MIDGIFNRIDEQGLVDWGVVYYGILGVPGIVERLDESLVRNFASSKLEDLSISDPLLTAVVEIATEINVDSGAMDSSVGKICHAYSVDLKRSLRIWRFASLEVALAKLDADPVYGLIILSDFWAAWGWSEDAPLSMQNLGKRLHEREYHSRSNYSAVIKDHKEWLVAEASSLQ
jgi:hypothetical protein